MSSPALWSDYRDTSWSWLAIGVLLAAWNACDDDPSPPVPRPGMLREYPVVSRRALESSRALQITASYAASGLRHESQAERLMSNLF